MKFLLISPKAKLRESMKNGSGFRIGQMTLAYLAALCPADVEVQIVDELLEEAPLDTDADLVGISTMTNVVERAYELADHYRSLGIPVILGGIHPTLCPEEASSHCDSIVIGEAEGLMEKLIRDAKKGKLRRVYKRKDLAPLDGIPIPRRELLDAKHYRTVNCIQISRGCPNSCSFCIVPVVHGKKYRLRPLDEVMTEIEGLKGHSLFVVDDNVVGKPSYAREFFKRLAPLNKRCLGQFSIRALRDPEMVRLIARAGFVGLFIGFETVNQMGLSGVGKKQTVQEYYDVIQRVLDHGMGMIGGFVFGLDTDGPDVFQRTVEFVDKSGLDIVQYTQLTPFPGTDIYRQFAKENRLVDRQWWLTSSWDTPQFYPAQMTRRQLREGVQWALRETYRLPKIYKRIRPLMKKRDLFVNGLSTYMNVIYRLGL